MPSAKAAGQRAEFVEIQHSEGAHLFIVHCGSGTEDGTDALLPCGGESQAVALDAPRRYRSPNRACGIEVVAEAGDGAEFWSSRRATGSTSR
jgi:hypothetical protein